jgi:hypothetical protein
LSSVKKWQRLGLGWRGGLASLLASRWTSTAAHAERLVRPDPVEELPVGLDLEAELATVADLESVGVLVLQ